MLNRPHEEPARFWELDGGNTATGVVKIGRRLSSAQLIVPTARGRVGEQRRLSLAPSEDQNTLVNDIREAVGRWRYAGHDGSTTTTRRLLDHWHSDTNVPRLFFAELEAAETLIWLAEVNASHDPSLAAFRSDLAAVSSEYNDGIERRCVKMATGSGKTVVMAMVIAWQALNASVTRRRDDLYTTSFVAITPGHTVRERLAVLNPSHPENVYREMQLVPTSLRGPLGQVNIRIVNFQAFSARDRLAGTSSDARKLLRRGNKARDPESPAATLDRVLRGLPSGTLAPKVCVLNDEAHHCYLPAEGRRTSEDDDGKAAAVWFSALDALRSAGRLAPVVYDFSATPIFIETGQRRERMFPWVVSDFPLMDALESGLVKIPQVPVSDDSVGEDVEWRNLYDPRDPRRLTRHTLPNKLRRAISALYDSYEGKYAQWMEPDPPAEPMPTPPVLIVVANSIPNAKAICEYIAGWAETDAAGRTAHHPGECALFANHTAHGPTRRLHTLLVHSKLEGDDGQFHRSVHGSGHDDRCQHKHQPMEVPACQAHRWSCTNARRSSARWSRICRRVGPPSAVGWVDIPRRWPGRSTPGAAVSATGRRRRSGAPRWRGDGRGGAAWRRRGRCGTASAPSCAGGVPRRRSARTSPRRAWRRRRASRPSTRRSTAVPWT